MKATEDDVKLIALLLRVDDGEQSMKIVSAYVESAESWLENAGVTIDYDDGLVRDAVAQFVGRRYDDPAQVQKYGNDSTALDALAEQIRLKQAKLAAETAGDSS